MNRSERFPKIETTSTLYFNHYQRCYIPHDFSRFLCSCLLSSALLIFLLTPPASLLPPGLKSSDWKMLPTWGRGNQQLIIIHI